MIKKKTCKRTAKRTTKRGKWSEEYKVKLSVKPLKRKKGNWSLFGLGKKKSIKAITTKRKKRQSVPRDYHRLAALDKLKKYYGGNTAKYKEAKKQFDKGYYGK